VALVVADQFTNFGSRKSLIILPFHTWILGGEIPPP
jgi:hypothetical protein